MQTRWDDDLATYEEPVFLALARRARSTIGSPGAHKTPLTRGMVYRQLQGPKQASVLYFTAGNIAGIEGNYAYANCTVLGRDESWNWIQPP